MTGAVKLNTAGGGGVALTPASSIASDVTVNVPSVSTTLVGTDTTQTLTNKTIQGGTVISGTAVASTSGTSIDFTSIPSWVKRITVMFNRVSTNGTSNVQVQLGTSSGATTTGYAVEGVTFNSSSANTGAEYTTGFPTEVYNPYATAAGLRSGSLVFNTLGSNIWVGNGIIGISWGSGPSSSFVAGKIDLAATLDRVRITTVNGTDTFDAGSINILYE